MRLIKMELNGFKSFIDKVSINFSEHGITTLIGPNGCGKSNIVDALRWALGEQSSQHLRGKSMVDVIFSGTEQRSAAGFCEVNLTFSNPKNISKFKYDDFPEILVTRRLYRDSTSEYQINKTSCRLLDIKDLFADTGLGGKRGYSIIEQGSVGMITTSKPSERRFLIEEAAGITKFKTKKLEAKKKLAETDQNLIRIKDILGELKSQEEILKKQASQANAYFNTKGKIDRTYNLIKAKQWQDINSKKDKLKSELALLEQTTLSKKIEFTSLDNNLTNQKAESLILEKEIEEKRLSLEKENVKRQNILSEIKLTEQQKYDLEKWQQKSEQEKATNEVLLDQARIKLNQTDKSIISIKQKIDSLLVQEKSQLLLVDQASNQILHIKDKLDGLNSSQLNLAKEQAKLNALVDLILSAKENKIDFNPEKDTELGEIKRQILEIENTIQINTEKIAQIEQSIITHQKELIDIQTKLSEQVEIKNSHEESLDRGQKNLLQIKENIIKLTLKLENLPSKTSYSLINKLALDNNLAKDCGWLGVLHDFLDINPNVDPSWLNQVESYLGVGILKDKSGVPLLLKTCQQLDIVDFKFIILSVKPQSLSDLKLPEGVNFTLDRSNLTLNNILATPLILNILVDGDIDNYKNSLSQDGFGVYRYNNHKSKQTYQEQQNYGQLLGKAKLAKTDELAKLTQNQTSLAETQADISTNEDLLVEINSDIQKFTAKKEICQHLLSRLNNEWQDKLALKNKRILGLERKSSEFNQQKNKLNDYQQRKLKVDEELLLLVDNQKKTRQHLEDKTEYKNQSLQKLHELKLQLNNFNNELNSFQQVVLLVTNDIKRKENLSHKIQDSKKLQKSDLKTYQDKIENLQNSANIGLKDASQLSQYLIDKKHTYQQNKNLLDKKEIELKLTFENLKKLESKNEVIQLKISQLQQDISTIETELFDFKKLKPEEVLRTFEASSFDISLGYEQLKSLKIALTNLSNVNLNALSEHEELLSRITFLDSQHEDLLSSISLLKQAIEKIDKTSCELFSKAFKAINEQFEEVFPLLFNGGAAKLTLIDEQNILETGVDIMACPPGKTTKNINLLSGGEKALTAIALIVAIFLYKPSPFCVLDEVDAPLDVNNIRRFCKMIKSLTSRVQFILITHNPKTMEVADYIYGVTMEESGVSKVVSVDLKAMTLPKKISILR